MKTDAQIELERDLKSIRYGFLFLSTLCILSIIFNYDRFTLADQLINLSLIEAICVILAYGWIRHIKLLKEHNKIR